MKLIVAAVALVCAFSTAARAEEVKQTFDAKAIKSIALDNRSGSLAITGAAADTLTVVTEKGVFESGCRLKVLKNGDALEIGVDADGSNLKCEVKFKLSVAPATALELRTGSGGIAIKGMTGPVEFKTGSGDVKIAGAPSKLSGKTGSGNISVVGLETGADLRAGSGDIAVAFSKVPDSGTLEVKTGSGNTTVEVPAGSRVITEFKSGSGKLSNELGDTPNAKFTVAVKAGSGNFKLKKAL